MKISVLVALYNTEKYVIQCLESIKNQTYTDFECIIVDDSSTDASYQIAKNYIQNDDRFLIYQIPHSGLPAVRNKGIELSNGEYIYFCDSDDFLYSNLLEECVSFMDKNELDMMFFNSDIICDTENKRQYYIEQNYLQRRMDNVVIMSGEDFLFDTVKNNNFIAYSFTQVFRKNKMKYQFYPKILSENELHTLQNLPLMKTVGYLPKTLYCKRSRNNSCMNCKLTYWHIHSYFIIFEEIKKYMTEYNHILSNKTIDVLEKIITEIYQIIKINWRKFDDKETHQIEYNKFIKKMVEYILSMSRYTNN